MGANAAAQTGTATQQSSNQVSNLLTGIGNAQAAGIVGGESARSQGVQNILQLGSTPAAAFAGSDKRIKTNIVEVGRDDLGGVYQFEYIYKPGSVYVGRIAQELLVTRPDAVIHTDSGILAVTEEFRPKLVDDEENKGES